jgi:hypothetical protein
MSLRWESWRSGWVDDGDSIAACGIRQFAALSMRGTSWNESE